MEKKLKGVCIGAGGFSHFQYEAWSRIPEVEIAASALDEASAPPSVSVAPPPGVA